MKKIILMIGFVLTTFLFLVEYAYATPNLGEFSYWYSNDSSVGYMASSSVKVACSLSTTCQMPSNTLLSLTNYGFNAWASSENLSLTSGTTTDYNWLSWGISRTEATNAGIPVNAEGATVCENRTFVANATYQGLTKKVYSISKGRTYFIWDNIGSGTAKTSDYSQTKWNAIGAHEFGHECGYFGHDINSTIIDNSLMNPYTNTYYDAWGVTIPQTRDLRHMGNM